MQGNNNKIGSQTDVDVYMIPVQSTSDKLTGLSSDSSESSIDPIILQRFNAEILYYEYTSECRCLSSSDVVQLWDKRNMIFHEASKECYMFHATTDHLEAVSIKTCSAGTRFLFYRDKTIKQHRSQLNPELTKMIQFYAKPCSLRFYKLLEA